MSWHEIADWLDNRHGLLDAVVFSGGEPLHQRGLVGAMWQAHDMGYRVALHTAGIYPDRLADVMPLVDWLSFDVKGPFADYPRITGAKRGVAAQRALSFVLGSGKPHEVRCTVDETVLTIDDASRMAREVAEMGVSRLVLQAQSDSYGNSVPLSPDFVNAMACWIECVERRIA
jgi:pyruvate formate lyase activating enzyme